MPLWDVRAQCTWKGYFIRIQLKEIFRPDKIQLKKSFHFIFSYTYFFSSSCSKACFVWSFKPQVITDEYNFIGAWWCLYQRLSSKLRVVLVMLQFLCFFIAQTLPTRSLSLFPPKKPTGIDVWTRRVGDSVKSMSISCIHKDFNRNGLNHDLKIRAGECESCSNQSKFSINVLSVGTNGQST